MKRTLLLTLSLAFVLQTSAAFCAEEEQEHLLRYKFEMGEVLRYEVIHTANVRSTIEGTTQQAESKSESVKAWKVIDVLPSGEMEFVHVVESVRMSNKVPNRAPSEYDSQEDETPPPGFEGAARAVGVPLSVIRMTPTGEVVHREQKHNQPEPTDDKPITLRLPAEPVEVGQQWDEKYEVPVQRKSGTTLQVQTRRVCELQEVSAGIATIGVEYQVLTPVDPFVESQLVDRLSKGVVRFDIERGRVADQQFDVDKRILGFAGPTSSMHYLARFEERMLKAGEKLAKKSPTQTNDQEETQAR